MAPSLGPSIGKKISSLAVFASFLAMGSIAWVSAQLIARQIATQSRDSSEQTASLLAATVDHELKSVAERSRLLIATALADFRSRSEQLQLLERSLVTDEGILAITLYTRPEDDTAKWTPTIRLTRPESAPDFVSESDLRELDTHHPLDLQNGDLVAAYLQDRFPVVRFAFPFERSANTNHRMISVEFHQEKLATLFSRSVPNFSFLLDRHHRVILQSEPAHFAFGEDVSSLPILQKSASSEIGSGRMDFSELPGGSEYYGAFSKTNQGKLLVITEAPKKTLLEAWHSYLENTMLWLGFGLVAIFAFIWATAWFLFGAPLERLAKGVERLEEGKTVTPASERFAPEIYVEDEIGDLARALQRLSVGFQTRKKATRSRKSKAAQTADAPALETHVPITIDSPAPSIEPATLHHTEPTRAVVLHCSLNGIERQAEKSDAETVQQQVTQLKQALTEIIESHQGAVSLSESPDSLTAYWIIPEEKSQAEKIEHALEASLALGTLFKERKEQNLDELSLTQGMHCGPVEATGGEKAPLQGDTVETSTRMASFALSLGAPTLVTGTVLAHAPQWFSTEKVAPADGSSPEIHELTGKAASIQADEPKIA